MSSSDQPVVIVGAGNLGKVLLDSLAGDERWRVVAFIDDSYDGEEYLGIPIFKVDAYDLRLTADAFMAIGYPAIRRSVLARVQPLGLNWRAFIDRRSMVGANVSLGSGVLVLSFAMVASGVKIGDFAYVSSYAHIGAGAQIGAFSSVLPGASVGASRVGEDCVIGLKSACIDGADIGDGAILSPYTFVRKSVPPGSLAVGNPARIFRGKRPHSTGGL